MTKPPRDFGLLDRLLSRTPGGAYRLAVPWDALNDIERQSLPVFLRRIGRAAVPLAFGAILTFSFGLVSGRPAPVAASVAVMVVLAFAYYQAWRRTESIEVEFLSCTERVAERGSVAWNFRVTLADNGLNARAPAAMIYAVFEGAAERERFLMLEPSAFHRGKPGEISWTADRGMGRHALRDFRLVVWDDLGLFPMCVPCGSGREVLVEPEYQELQNFVLKGNSLSIEDGGLEALRSGDSSSFRGVRPWRNGDSMRRIDWRRSMRANEIIIREFDRHASTEAVFCFDQSVGGHSSFGSLSSYETLKDAALALARWFMQRRAPVGFETGTVSLPPATGRMADEMLASVVRDLPPVLTSVLPDLLRKAVITARPHTVLVLFSASHGLNLDALWEDLLTLDEMQVEVVFVLTDSARFISEVKKSVTVGKSAEDAVQILLDKSMDEQSGTLARLADKLLTRALVLGPRETLAGLMDQERGAA